MSENRDLQAFSPPPRQAATSHGLGFWGYYNNITCHSEFISGSKNKMLNQVQHDMKEECREKAAFTLAESADARHFGNNHRCCAFTLAETLITLMVIGVVAVLTMPSLMTQVNDYTLQKQKDVFSKKWAEGLRRMRADGALDNTYTTETFINRMKNYFAITNVCDSNSLANCFSEKITSYENGEAEVFEVKDLKSAKNFNKSEEDAPVYGLKFSDGTSMLLAYKKDCKGITEFDSQGNHTACLLYVYDVNGNKSPNSYGGNTGSDTKKTDNEISTMNKGRDLVGNASITKGNAFGLSFEFEMYPSRVQYPEAIERCGGQDKLPTKAQLDEIAKALYVDSGICPGITEITEGYQNGSGTNYVSRSTCDTNIMKTTPLFQALGGSNVCILTNQGSVATGVYKRCFYEEGTNSVFGTQANGNFSGSVMCIK